MFTLQELIAALMEDEEWELPPEDREMTLMDLGWTLLDL